MCEAPSQAFSAELLVTCCLLRFRAEGCGLGIQGLEDEPGTHLVICERSKKKTPILSDGPPYECRIRL